MSNESYSLLVLSMTSYDVWDFRRLSKLDRYTKLIEVESGADFYLSDPLGDYIQFGAGKPYLFRPLKPDKDYLRKYAVKSKLRKLVLANRPDYFITLTFANREISKDFDSVMKAGRLFTRRLHDRFGARVVLIPELHKDKIHYHFHGFVFGEVKLLETEHQRFIRPWGFKVPVFKSDLWEFGGHGRDGLGYDFWTAAKFPRQPDQSEWDYKTSLTKGFLSLAYYSVKYITKDFMNRTRSRFRYVRSRGLSDDIDNWIDFVFG